MRKKALVLSLVVALAFWSVSCKINKDPLAPYETPTSVATVAATGTTVVVLPTTTPSNTPVLTTTIPTMTPSNTPFGATATPSNTGSKTNTFTPTPSGTNGSATPTFTPTYNPSAVGDLAVTDIRGTTMETVPACVASLADVHLGMFVDIANVGQPASIISGAVTITVQGSGSYVFNVNLQTGFTHTVWVPSTGGYPSNTTVEVTAPAALDATENKANNTITKFLPMATPPPICTGSVTATFTPTPTFTGTISWTPTACCTTGSITPTFTRTPTWTPSQFTGSVTNTFTPTFTSTQTATRTATYGTPTNTPTGTATPVCYTPRLGPTGYPGFPDVVFFQTGNAVYMKGFTYYQGTTCEIKLYDSMNVTLTADTVTSDANGYFYATYYITGSENQGLWDVALFSGGNLVDTGTVFASTAIPTPTPTAGIMNYGATYTDTARSFKKNIFKAFACNYVHYSCKFSTHTAAVAALYNNAGTLVEYKDATVADLGTGYYTLNADFLVTQAANYTVVLFQPGTVPDAASDYYQAGRINDTSTTSFTVQ